MYITLDMGTSNTRLNLCSEGCLVDTKKMSIGAGSTKSIGKDALFLELKKLLDAVLFDNNITVESVEYILASGMAGSELGLCEIPHISLPIDISTLTDNLQERTIPQITSIPFLFVPGVKRFNGDVIDDIMRGEEVESIGVFYALSLDKDIILVLPGTHNKVIHVRSDGTVADFYTTLSGEILNNIITDSILTGQVTHEFEICEAYVLRGALYSRKNGFNAALFHIRVMALNGVGRDILSSFLYGCVIGQDIDRILRFAAGKSIFIGGRSNLKHTYRILLDENATALDDDICTHAVNNGLAAIHRIYQVRKSRNAVLQSIETEKLIAIVRNPDEESLLPAMQALYRGGIRLAEITFDRSGKIPKSHTAHLIRLIKEQLPMLVGAGTVTSIEEVKLAYEAGASFIISPNCDTEIISITRRLGMVSIPAAFTPTEISSAIKAGADYVKLFPADQLLGSYVKAVKAPLSDAKLLAVGGVNKNNIAAFIHNGFSGVGVGSNLYDKQLIARSDWTALESLTKEYVDSLTKA